MGVWKEVQRLSMEGWNAAASSTQRKDGELTFSKSTCKRAIGRMRTSCEYRSTQAAAV